MTGSWDWRLVALSVLIATLASYTALDLAGRVTAARGRVRRAWLVAGSVAMGVGIWSMHFVGMLAFRLPVPMAYDVPSLGLSVLVAVVASALALHVVSRDTVGVRSLVTGGLLMGPAIAGMHYIGMAGLRVPAHLAYHGPTVALSVLIAVGAAVAALWLAFHFRDDGLARMGSRLRRVLPRAASAVLMGAGVAGMHYTGMAAARFSTPVAGMRVAGDHVLATAGLGGAVVVSTISLLAVALFGAMADRWLAVRTQEASDARRSEERLRAYYSLLSVGVLVQNAGGEVIYANEAAARLLGTEAERLRGRRSGHPLVVDLWREDGAPDTGDTHPVAIARRTGVPVRGVLRAVRDERAGERASDRSGERWLLVDAVPLEDEGQLLVTFTDITERRRLERALRYAADASAVLAESLDYERTLARVAQLAVPEFADWSAVDLLAADAGPRRLRRLAVAHADPAQVERVRQLEERWPVDLDAPGGVADVLRTGEPLLVPVITDAMLAASTADPERLRMTRALGLRSYIAAPLRAGERVIGVVTFATAESGRTFGEADLAFAADLARRMAAAIENARLYREVGTAREELEQQAALLEANALEMEESQEELEVINDELQSANDELLRKTEEAERARVAADEANRAKSEFLAMMSHELRTPLNAIGGYTQLLELGVRGPITEAQRLDLQRIQRSQAHLARLVNDVLNFARLEAGQVEFRVEDVALEPLLAGMDAMIRPQLEAKTLVYEYRGGDPAVTVRADRDRLQQVVLNLLTNAVKFTEPGGRIVLDWTADERCAHVRVSDTGIGIAPEKLAAIFEPFVQVDRQLTAGTEGIGLGLAISRDIARAMGGELEARSRLGEGSTFLVTVPRASPASGASSAPAAAAR